MTTRSWWAPCDSRTAARPRTQARRPATCRPRRLSEWWPCNAFATPEKLRTSSQRQPIHCGFDAGVALRSAAHRATDAGTLCLTLSCGSTRASRSQTRDLGETNVRIVYCVGDRELCKHRCICERNLAESGRALVEAVLTRRIAVWTSGYTLLGAGIASGLTCRRLQWMKFGTDRSGMCSGASGSRLERPGAGRNGPGFTCDGRGFSCNGQGTMCNAREQVRN